MAVCQNLVHLVNIKIAGKWMFIPLKMVLIGIDPYPYPNFGDRHGHLHINPSAGVASHNGHLFGADNRDLGAWGKWPAFALKRSGWWY